MADARPDDDLDRRIASARAVEQARSVGAPPPAKGYAQGTRVLMELIGAPVGGFILGYALDRWLGTGYWLTLVFVVLAFVVAFRNIIRISKQKAE